MTGISYLSRAQESAARIRLGTALPSLRVMKSSSPSTVADTVFVERIRSKVKYWRESCKSSDTNKSRDGKKIFSIFFVQNGFSCVFVLFFNPHFVQKNLSTPLGILSWAMNSSDQDLA